MIDPIIAKINLSMEVEIKKSDLNINKLEEKIIKASNSAGCKCLSESIEKINEYFLKECRDKKKEPIHSHKTGHLETVMGPVDYKYTKVKNKKSKKYYSPEFDSWFFENPCIARKRLMSDQNRFHYTS